MSRTSRITLGLLLGAAVAAFLFRSPLVAWFSPQPASTPDRIAPPHGGAASTAPTGSAAQQPTLPRLPAVEFPPPVLTHLRRGLELYEQVRARLATDRIEGIATFAHELGDALRAASGGAGVSAATAARLTSAAGASDALASATTLASARTEFGAVSEPLITVIAADVRLHDRVHLFDCTMAGGYGGWIQPTTALENPYMGSKMLTCGTTEPWVADEPSASATSTLSHEGHGHEGSDVAFHTCSMHPSVRQATPGTCPICGMKLTPVTFEQQESGTILIDRSRTELLGIQTATATATPMTRTVRAVGRVAYDETRLQDVTLKTKGWIARLEVNATGQAVARGQRLLTLYSPELFAAQQEYLLALQASVPTPGSPTSSVSYAARLAAASAKKLRLLGMTARQLDELRTRGTPLEEVPVHAPASGYVIAKDVVEGAAVEAGQRLFRIAALDRIWVEAAVYEGDLAHVKAGAVARVSLPFAEGSVVAGKVAVVYPYLDASTRTGKVRVELPNKDLALKPDMYADVELDLDLGTRLAVPVSAVVYTGARRIVFLDLGGGRYRPQEVTLGVRAGDDLEIVRGLEPGQRIVVEGNFLIAAESRIRSASYWEASDATR